MSRINLTKYGFIRCPEEDFSDDGTRFYVFKCGYLKLTKAVVNDDIYLSLSVIGSLTYDEYSKLPSYKSCDTLNGVNKNTAFEMLDDVVYEWFNYLREYKQTMWKKQHNYYGYVINKTNNCKLVEFMNNSFVIYTDVEYKYTNYIDAIEKFMEVC